MGLEEIPSRHFRKAAKAGQLRYFDVIEEDQCGLHPSNRTTHLWFDRRRSCEVIQRRPKSGLKIYTPCARMSDNKPHPALPYSLRGNGL